MRPWIALLVCILYSSIVGYQLAQGDEGSDFLNYKEQQVQNISQQARENDQKKCEFVQSCSDPGQCTRRGCSPLKDDQLECTAMINNQRCLENATCDNIRVNFGRSYVRYPRYDYDKSSDQDSVTAEVRDSICSQRMLDPTFVQLLGKQRARNETSSKEYYFNFYFGSVDGTFRFYPGLEIKDCSGYDPRIRPWYVGAISVLKDIVVLLDKGSSMAEGMGLTFSATSGQIADILTQHLLKTLTPGDHASIITFDSLGANLLGDYSVPLRGLNISDIAFQNLLLLVNETRGPQGSSSYTTALMKAVSTLNGSSREHLKIIVLFTDGKSTDSPPEDQIAAVSKELQDQSIRLFIYKIPGSPNSLLDTIACSSQGYHQNVAMLPVLQNPLYSLNSYFTFLARSNIETFGSTLGPFWQPIYPDYGNLGDIITVAYPVMSSDGLRLIGVAGIDIQISNLPSILKSQLDESLRSRRNTIANNTKGVTLDNCTAILDDDDVCTSTITKPTCDKDDHKSTYKDLLCCGECLVDDKKDSQTGVIIAVVLVVTAFSGLSLTGGLIIYLKFCRSRTRPPPIVDIVKVPKFSYEQLYLATNRFSASNKLGKGTFGIVYIGTLDDGRKVAIKKLHFKPDNDMKDFEAEIRILATANHNNLLALKGFCVDQFYMLVYELLENGDLDDWLFEKPLEGKVLSWAQRVVIAKGTARGLAYLHEELQNDQKVCHSDIKPANILLDKDFNPKVADFGMAKLYDRGDDLYANGGTLGYMAPEILNGALADTKADVYSYGMVLLEMVTGRRFSEFKTESLRYWANNRVVEGREREIVDLRLEGLDEDEQTAARNLLNIALCCTMVDPDARPDMSAVVKMIEGFLPVPLPFTNDQHQKFGASTETTGHSAESFQWEGSWTMSQVLTRIQGTGKEKGGKPPG